MEPLVVEAGVKITHIQLKDPNISETLLKEAIIWLRNIKEVEWAKCVEVKALLPQEEWDRYLWIGMEGAHEVNLKNQAFTALRKAIVNKARPSAFRKRRKNGGKKRTEEQSTGSGSQSQAQGTA
jgi:hypothetical protein